MKKLKRMIYVMLSLCLLLTMSMPVRAVEKKDEYTYTVRFFSGKQGTFRDGSEIMVFKDLKYGDSVTFRNNSIILNDNSKYYVRGIRESGKDNSDSGSGQNSSFKVTGDRDYVVAYGILGNVTSYTINYEDSEGNELAPSETYYGNVGDKPVIAYAYIEGWQPQAYNLTKTLQKDPAENEFTFVYTRIGEGAPGTPALYEDEGITVIPGGGAPGGGAGAGGENPEGEEITDEETPLGTPDELVDLDEEEVPLANLPFIENATPLNVLVPVIVGTLGAVGAAWYFLIMKRKKNKTADNGEK